MCTSQLRHIASPLDRTKRNIDNNLTCVLLEILGWQVLVIGGLALVLQYFSVILMWRPATKNYKFDIHIHCVGSSWNYHVRTSNISDKIKIHAVVLVCTKYPHPNYLKLEGSHSTHDTVFNGTWWNVTRWFARKNCYFPILIIFLEYLRNVSTDATKNLLKSIEP